MWASDSAGERGPEAGAALWEPAGFWKAKSLGLPRPGSVRYFLGPGDVTLLGKECGPGQLLLRGLRPLEVVETLPEMAQASWPHPVGKAVLGDPDGNGGVADWLTQFPRPGFSGG